MKLILIKLCYALLSCLIPTDKNLLLFGAWYGDKYGDNPRYFFEWLTANPAAVDGKQCYWVTKNRAVFDELNSQHKNVVYGKGLAAIWLHLRAGAVFCNCSPDTDLYGQYLNKKTRVFNLWHGTPIKKIGFDAINSSISSQRLGIKPGHRLSSMLPSWLKTCANWLLAKELYYLASSEEVATILVSAMRVERQQVIVNGYPKLDHLITEKKRPEPGSILYAPTYRGEYRSENDLLSIFGFDADQVDAWLVEHDKTLTIRLHPANSLPSALINQIGQCVRITLGGTSDLYQEITGYELIVTDFSGLFYDAVAAGLKTVIAPFGLVDYVNQDRQLYFSPEQLFPFAMADNWPELLTLFPFYFSQPMDLCQVKSKFYIDDNGDASRLLWQKISVLLDT